MKLRGSDLALAQITSRWQDSLKLFEQFQEECERVGFAVELGLLVRALVVYATGQSRFRNVNRISLESLKSGWEDAKAGFRFAINFLRANVGIEDECLLSSPLFVITIGFFARSRQVQLSHQDERGLRKWLYIANARGHYTRGSSETILDADLKILKDGGTATELIEALRQHVGRLTIEPADFVGRGIRSALFATTYLALKANGARDWRSQLALSLMHQGRNHAIQFHHIFPKAVLHEHGYEKAAINEIANMAFVAGGLNRSISSTPPAKYLPTILERQGREALEKDCVPAESSLWGVEAYPTFLEHRRALLAERVNAFIEDADGSAETLSVSALIAAGESERVEFKSSARWDYRENKANKVMETMIVKTIAAFLNAKGGTLLIGVDDEGKVLGLEPDYKTLGRRANRDGYEQFLMTLVSTQLGKEVCSCLAVSFHMSDERELCEVRVGASPKPAYVTDGGAPLFYLRTGNITQALSMKEALDYARARWPLSSASV